MARAPQVTLVDTLPAGARIGVDRLQIQQVLLNLLKNGYDASREQPPDRHLLEVRLASADGKLDISVRDHGSGLDAAAHQHLFEAFFTTKTDGLGLGLSICRSIAEAHGGRLIATSPPAASGPDTDPNSGPGTCFTLSLPGLTHDHAHD